MIKKMYMAITLFPLFSIASFNDLESGVGVNNANVVQIAENSWEYAYASRAQEEHGDGFSAAFYLTEDQTELFSMSDANNLYLIDYVSKVYSTHWPLNRWEHHLDYTERTNRLSYFSISISDYTLDIQSPLGCLNSTPLRYGDVDADGENEIVLVLGNDLVVFSVEYGRIVFSVNLDLVDWMSGDETHYLYEDEAGVYSKSGSEPQFASAIPNTHRIQRENIKGFRGYSKLYVSEFDEDGFADLLIWQKVYESKLEGDSVRGFEQVRNEFMHFERDLISQAETEAGVTGEFLPQETSEEDIQNWLSVNDLTWSKGYPSKSECPGEEGELIPEMHDPLLNDPEVLQ